MAIYWGHKRGSKCRGLGVVTLTCIQFIKLLFVLYVIFKPFLKELTVRDNA